MPRYIKDDRDPIETSLPAEGVQLRAEGWREVKARTNAVREADAEREADFDQGGTLPAGKNKVHNSTGKAEPLVTDPKADEPKKSRK